jgi:hypothetical protein
MGTAVRLLANLVTTIVTPHKLALTVEIHVIARHRNIQTLLLMNADKHRLKAKTSPRRSQGDGEVEISTHVGDIDS